MAEQTTQPFENYHHPVIKVLGLGGGGSNAVNRMIELGLGGVEFIVANTDQQALESSLADTRLQLGPKLTRGLGAGGDPEIGRKAAEESRNEIRAALDGADMVFITAGMGGGTGTGSIAVAGEIAKELGAVTIAIVTTPFSFEMGRRQKNASDGINALRPNTDTLIVIPNERLLFAFPQNIPLEVAFRLADDVLRQAVQGIAELITEPGVMNVDFSHVRNMMKLGGGAFMAIGQGHDGNKALSAIQQALNHPLLESVSLEEASGVIVNFTGGDSLTLLDIGEALGELHGMSNKNVEIIMGYNEDPSLTDMVQVILVITGLGATTLEEVLPGSSERLALDVPPPNPSGQISQEEFDTIEEQLISIPLAPQPSLVGPEIDLDIPAFMRKDERYANNRVS